MQITPVTPELTEALSDLLDSVAPASRCSCMYWRIGSEYRQRKPADNRRDLLAIVDAGPPPGLVAFDGETAVGWCQVTSRSDLPALEASTYASVVGDPPDEKAVWSISCFVIRPGHRRQGIATALIDAAIGYARGRGATVLEAYPLDGSVSPSSTFTGYASTFRRLGFVTARYARPSRPVMRLVLRPQASSSDGAGSAGR